MVIKFTTIKIARHDALFNGIIIIIALSTIFFGFDTMIGGLIGIGLILGIRNYMEPGTIIEWIFAYGIGSEVQIITSGWEDVDNPNIQIERYNWIKENSKRPYVCFREFHQTDKGLLELHYSYRFLYKSDAMAFKLRWI